jgi:hypothetical protein
MLLNRAKPSWHLPALQLLCRVACKPLACIATLESNTRRSTNGFCLCLYCVIILPALLELLVKVVLATCNSHPLPGLAPHLGSESSSEANSAASLPLLLPSKPMLLSCAPLLRKRRVLAADVLCCADAHAVNPAQEGAEEG